MTIYNFNGDTQIDEFGVDHSNFSLRDEIEYNFRRAEELNNNKTINYKQLARDYANVIPMDNNDRFTQPNKYNIRDDKNYAWDLPKQKYFTPVKSSYKSYWDGVPKALLTGFAEGVIGGTERLINGISGGNYGSFIDKKMNNSYTNRQNKLQNRAYSAGLGYAHDLANTIIDTDAEIAKYYYAAKLGNKL